MWFSLQNYTTYSIFSGVKQPEDWLKHCVEAGHRAFGISEKKNMSSAMEFYAKAKKVAPDMKLIYGVELHVYRDAVNRADSDYRGTVLVYAMNQTGFNNIIALNNYSQRKDRGFYKRQRIDEQTLFDHSDGVLVVVPEVDGYLFEGGVFNEVGFFKLTEHCDNVYVGINRVEREEIRYPDIAKQVPLFDAHVPSADLGHLYEVVRNVDKNQQMSFNRGRTLNACFIPSEDEYRAVYGDTYDDVFGEIYELCTFTPDLSQTHMPETDDDADIDGAVQRYLIEGIKKKLVSGLPDDIETIYDERFDAMTDVYPKVHIIKRVKKKKMQPVSEYIKQLRYEVSIIQSKGYYPLFLILRSIIHIVRMAGHDVGPGRGSAAGALFTYLMGITNIDPILHNLSFERFMNPDRNDLPDIDIDFSRAGKEILVAALRERYGYHRVTKIGSYNRFRPSSAIQKIAGAYGYHIKDNDGNLIPYEKYTLEQICDVKGIAATRRGIDELAEMRENPQFEAFYQRHSKWMESVVIPLLESISSTSKHAAGIVILPEGHEDLVPIVDDTKHGIVTQYDKVYIEKAGYVKLDILLLDGVGTISAARKVAEETYDCVIPDSDEIPLDDPATIALFNTVQTDAIFTFNTYSQKMFLERLKPTCFEDIVAAIAIVRPGPQGAGADVSFIERKHGREEITYLHPDLEPILKETYGLMIYQEQMMEICRKIAGMSGSQADYVRKACGKKDIKMMAQYEDSFVDGCVKMGYDKKLANTLWEQIAVFAEYSFNKAHSAAYAKLAFEAAYLKAHYPLAFWCGVMRNGSDDKKKENIYDLRIVAEDCGINFVFPNIHAYASDFTPLGDSSIIWPLSAMKGIGESVSEVLREAGGGSDTIANFYIALQEASDRLGKKANPFNKNHWHILIKAGFFDPVMKPWEAALEYYRQRNYRKYKNPARFRERIEENARREAGDLLTEDLFEWSRMKMEVYQSQIESWKKSAPFHPNIHILYREEFEAVESGTPVFVGGMVVKVRTKQNVYGQFFRTLYITDYNEEFKVQCRGKFIENATVFPVVGQIVELVGIKNVWRPKDRDNVYHSVDMSEAGSYIRIVVDNT